MPDPADPIVMGSWLQDRTLVYLYLRTILGAAEIVLSSPVLSINWYSSDSNSIHVFTTLAHMARHADRQHVY